MISRTLTYVTLILAALALSVGYMGPLAGTLAGLIALLAGLTALLVWLAAEIFKVGWLAPLSFALLVGAAGVGVYLSADALWMVLAVVSGLSAWSLGNFSRRLLDHEQVVDRPALERAYLLRLALLDTVSVVLAGLTLRLHTDLGFVVILALAALLIFGVSRMVFRFRHLIGVKVIRDEDRQGSTGERPA